MSSVPAPVDLGWAAGFLEGEGSFWLQKISGKRGDYGYPVVSAVQREREPLDHLLELFGGRIYREGVRAARPNTLFKWQLYAEVELLNLLRPLMSERRQRQIDVCIAGTRRQESFAGELNGRAKLTKADVLSMRASTAPTFVLAEQFGVAESTVRGILQRRSWAHV